jgi:hypothetical protein
MAHVSSFFDVHVQCWLVDVSDLNCFKSSNLLISIGVFLNLCCQDSDQKAKMVITEKLHNSLEFVAPGVADPG